MVGALSLAPELEPDTVREQVYAAFKQDAARAWNEYQRTGLHLTFNEADAWLARLEAGEDVEPPACHV